MTRYEELTQHLFSLNRPDVPKEIGKLTQLLGNPHLKYPTVHVAGTNGKGTVTHKIAKALELSGYKVGCFTSPHLFSFTERIQVDGECISEDEVVEGLEKLLTLCETPKFFEMTTALAFDYFAKKQVDIAIIETGLGGRLDATNITRPLVSVITSVDLDHEAVLGPTLDAIAEEKGGVIKPSTPIVLGPNVHQKILWEIAEKQNAPLYQVKGSYVDYEEENQAISSTALELLMPQFPQTEKAIAEGLASRPRCRFEITYAPEPFIFDVAHNPAALKCVLMKIKEQFPKRPITLLFSCSKDKDLDGFIQLFRGYVKQVYLFNHSHPRLVDKAVIVDALERNGYHDYDTFESANQAAEKALEKIKQTGGVCLIAGSFFVMESFLSLTAQC